MKRAIGALVAAVCLLAASASQAGLMGFLSVKVSGTIQQQVELPVGQKVVVGKLSNQTLFDAFGVSPDDYELVMTFNGPGELEFLPKITPSGLPVIVVLTLVDDPVLVDTQSRQWKIGGGVSSTTNAGVFDHLLGGVNGSLHFDKQGFPNGVSLSGLASSLPSHSLFKLKISSHGLFVQAPAPI